MKLLERLNFYLEKLKTIQEGTWDSTITRSGRVDYVINPSSNELRQYIKDECESYARGVKIGKDFYFWPAKHAIHEDFVKSLGKQSQWNPWDKFEIQKPLQIGWQMVNDYYSILKDDTHDFTDEPSSVYYKIINHAILLIKELHNKYGIAFDKNIWSDLQKGKDFYKEW